MKTEQSGITDRSYCGYSIGFNHYTNSWFVKKDGAFIGYAKSEEHARNIVDELTAPVNP